MRGMSNAAGLLARRDYRSESNAAYDPTRAAGGSWGGEGAAVGGSPFGPASDIAGPDGRDPLVREVELGDPAAVLARPAPSRARIPSQCAWRS